MTVVYKVEYAARLYRASLGVCVRRYKARLTPKTAFDATKQASMKYNPAAYFVFSLRVLVITMLSNHTFKIGAPGDRTLEAAGRIVTSMSFSSSVRHDNNEKTRGDGRV
ncbi:hypothetical protein IMZ48_27990 [Candidatus Bathyarchaeota archaeon]|nr:hypothetical protein [Candidatus Bathyarchaeota archaeon]